jgi:RimJ/RimL family protein N-acetyltransferase
LLDPEKAESMNLELIPVKQYLRENTEFLYRPECQESIYMSIDFYNKTGFHPPWIGYYVSIDGVLVGSAAFKGKPIGGKVEIAYGTFEPFRKMGVGTAIAGQLVELSLKTDPDVRILARTLPEENYSAKILRKNGFELLGPVMDGEDGEVWEWEFRATTH